MFSGSNNLMMGILYVLLGIIITGVTYSHAQGGGGGYVVTTGLFVVGVIKIIRGLTSR